MTQAGSDGRPSPRDLGERVDDDIPSADDRYGRLTDERIITTRREVLRRFGSTAAVVALGGLVATCGDESGPTTTTRTPDTTPDVGGATLSRPDYTGAGGSGSDTDVNRQADPKGDSDVTRQADPPADTDVTTFGDPAGAGTNCTDNDTGAFADPAGGGTNCSDTDVTVTGDPPADTDVTTVADPKGDADVTTTADPVRPRP